MHNIWGGIYYSNNIARSTHRMHVNL
uniref:Uncharacterized protein n=1 Tax=Arundo donax TaxID=35708 RepID=A0A0A9ALS2_ARUDO